MSGLGIGAIASNKQRSNGGSTLHCLLLSVQLKSKLSDKIPLKIKKPWTLGKKNGIMISDGNRTEVDAMSRGTNQKFKFTYLMQVMLEKTDDEHSLI